MLNIGLQFFAHTMDISMRPFFFIMFLKQQ